MWLWVPILDDHYFLRAATSLEERHTWVWTPWRFKSQHGSRWGGPPPEQPPTFISPFCLTTLEENMEVYLRTTLHSQETQSALSHYVIEREITQRPSSRDLVRRWLTNQRRLNFVMRNTTPRNREATPVLVTMQLTALPETIAAPRASLRLFGQPGVRKARCRRHTVLSPGPSVLFLHCVGSPSGCFGF